MNKPIEKLPKPHLLSENKMQNGSAFYPQSRFLRFYLFSFGLIVFRWEHFHEVKCCADEVVVFHHFGNILRPNVAVTMHYMGSLEIMNALKAGGQDHDAVWPASSMWISMGDTKHIVKDAASTSTTPIVFGIAKSKAVKLGWADDTGATKPVSTADILAAVSDGKLTFSMTSATVIDSALNVYQTALRKPSWTIWVVDYSGSMSGEGKNGVVKGLNAALDPDQAKKSYIPVPTK